MTNLHHAIELLHRFGDKLEVSPNLHVTLGGNTILVKKLELKRGDIELTESDIILHSPGKEHRFIKNIRCPKLREEVATQVYKYLQLVEPKHNR